jgi:hypothetical protein
VDDHRSGKIVIQLNGRYVSEIIYFCPAYAYMIQNQQDGSNIPSL